MNEFIKERFSYLADNKKENAPELRKVRISGEILLG